MHYFSCSFFPSFGLVIVIVCFVIWADTGPRMSLLNVYVGLSERNYFSHYKRALWHFLSCTFIQEHRQKRGEKIKEKLHLNSSFINKPRQNILWVKRKIRWEKPEKEEQPPRQMNFQKKNTEICNPGLVWLVSFGL